MVRIIKKEKGKALMSEYVWEMGEREHSEWLPCFRLGQQVVPFPKESSQGRSDVVFRFKAVAFEVPEEQAKGESILIKTVRN